MLRLGEPFCDNLRLSSPDANFVDALAVLSSLTFSDQRDGCLGCGAEGGTIYTGVRHRVHVIEFSGLALKAIRAAGLMRDLVLELNEVPHRVTRLDATCDFIEDAPPGNSRPGTAKHPWSPLPCEHQAQGNHA